MSESELRELQYQKYKLDRIAELHEKRRFHRFQLAVFNAIFKEGYKRIFIRKGRKGGGTECIMYPVSRIIGTTPGAAAYIVGPTQKGQSEIIWDNRRIHSFLPRAWGGVANEKDKRIRLSNQSFVKIEGADDPDAARGWEGDIFVWDEYKDHNPLAMEACYPNLASRDGIWIVLGTPPTKKTNHYYLKEQEIREDPDWAFFHWTIWDNEFLPGGHEWIRKEREKYYKRGDWDLWEIEYEARYVFNSQRKVIPNFDSEVYGKHVVPRTHLLKMIERDKAHLKWVCAIDPGYATCFAVLFGCYNPYTSQMFWLDEIYSTDRTQNAARDMWPLIEQKQRQLHRGKWATIYDEAALSFAVEVRALARDEGRKVNLIPTNKKKGDEDGYFRALNGSFAERGQSYVAQECKKFIWEMDDYETDENDNYPDENNHLLDSARYILKFLGFTNVLKQGDTITVPSHPRPQTFKDLIQEEREQEDFVGFGGSEACFTINDVMKNGF